MKRLLDWDPWTRTQTWFHKESGAKEYHIEEIQDVTPHMERAAALRNMGTGGAMGLNEFSRQGIKRDMWHVATVPNWLITKWFNEEGIRFYRKEDWPRVRAKLNSSEYAWLRTGTGRI